MQGVQTMKDTDGMSTTTIHPSDADWLAFQQECECAFGKMIALARRLHPKGETQETAHEYSKEVAKIGVMHGLTFDETLRAGLRVWMMTRDEAHA
jgi:hypothetical protein